TLLLQTLCKLAEQMKTLYVTGEESLQQVAMRAHRLGLPTANLAVRVPTINVTAIDLSVTVKKPVKASEVNQLLQKAAQGAFHGI
ncbi:hypothetical protein ONK27_27075, partial [Salmonella enterica subsp. enterica serovar Virginia]|nr:hypothetical protein [Salmonella enterica subsp. enterica serovar Virginia]